MKPRITGLALTLALAGLLPGCAYISRASQTDTGVQADSDSAFASPSSDGRWVAFQSFATNLVPDDTNGKWDVFVRDNVTKRVVRVSIRDDGTEGNGHSQYPSISDDGRRVVFASEATNLSPNDSNTEQDIYIHDRDTDNDGILDEPGAASTRLLSVTSTGGSAPFGSATLPKIFGNGLGAVYASTAALVPADTNGPKSDVYATSIAGLTPVTTLISRPVGTSDAGNGGSDSAAVNADGTVVAFATTSTNLVAGDTNGRVDVVIWDAHTSAPTLTRATGAVVADDDNDSPDVSRDPQGQFVAFDSAATNIVPGKTNSQREVYVLDRSTGAITAESRDPLGESANAPSVHPSINADGTRVAYESDASNLAEDTNGQTDVFVRDRPSDLTQIASTAKFLDQANGASHLPAMSADGRLVAFHSGAANLVSPDANGVAYDVFTHAAIVPQIFSVTRSDIIFFLGPVESAPRLHWGANKVHINGKGFAPDVTVDLGAGLTISNVQITPTDITFDATVPSGTAAGTRNLVIENPASVALGGRGGTQVCVGCVSIQRWSTAPDPVNSRSPIAVLSDGEFTSATVSPDFVTIAVFPTQIWLQLGNIGSGSHDLTLQQTANGTVTCTGCLHVA
jgi:WD40-like Beta Propeller Repeat